VGFRNERQTVDGQPCLFGLALYISDVAANIGGGFGIGLAEGLSISAM
jgi:hypothetical protein